MFLYIINIIITIINHQSSIINYQLPIINYQLSIIIIIIIIIINFHLFIFYLYFILLLLFLDVWLLLQGANCCCIMTTTLRQTSTWCSPMVEFQYQALSSVKPGSGFCHSLTLSQYILRRPTYFSKFSAGLSVNPEKWNKIVMILSLTCALNRISLDMFRSQCSL